MCYICNIYVSSQSYSFPVVMCGCESLTIKKAEHQNTDAFELWAGEDLRAPWTVKRSNQSILKEINPIYSLGGLMPKLQYYDLLMQKADSLEKTLILVDWRQKEKGVGEDEMVGWHRWLNWHEFEQTPADSEGQGSLVCCRPWGRKELDIIYIWYIAYKMYMQYICVYNIGSYVSYYMQYISVHMYIKPKYLHPS